MRIPTEPPTFCEHQAGRKSHGAAETRRKRGKGGGKGWNSWSAALRPQSPWTSTIGAPFKPTLAPRETATAHIQRMPTEHDLYSKGHQAGKAALGAEFPKNSSNRKQGPTSQAVWIKREPAGKIRLKPYLQPNPCRHPSTGQSARGTQNLPPKDTANLPAIPYAVAGITHAVPLRNPPRTTSASSCPRLQANRGARGQPAAPRVFKNSEASHSNRIISFGISKRNSPFSLHPFADNFRRRNWTPSIGFSKTTASLIDLPG